MKNTIWLLYLVLAGLLAGCARGAAPAASDTPAARVTAVASATRSVTVTNTAPATVTPTGTRPLNLTATVPFISATPTRVVVDLLTPKPVQSNFDIPGNYQIAFATGGELGNGLYVLSSGNNITQIVDDPGGLLSSPTWSPDGHWLAYARVNLDWGYTDGPDKEIFIVRRDGAENRQLTFGDGDKRDPAWSPDGKLLVISQSEHEYMIGDLYIIGIVGQYWRRLTNTPENEVSPTWSPDGQKIAYLLGRADGFELHVMNSDGTGDYRVGDFLVPWGNISWAPDGSRLAYRSNGACGDICYVNLDGTGKRCFQNPGTCISNADPAWSPDGSWLVYSFDQGFCSLIDKGPRAGDQLGVLKVNDTQDEQFLPLGVCGSDAAWSPVPALHIGSTYRITSSGDHLNLRVKYSQNGTVLTKIAAGEQVTILEGPIDVDNYYWWRMRTADGIEGWAVEVAGWYALVPTTTPTPTISTTPASVPWPARVIFSAALLKSASQPSTDTQRINGWRAAVSVHPSSVPLTPAFHSYTAETPPGAEKTAGKWRRKIPPNAPNSRC